MQDFISWVEKDGQILFLTSDDIESEHGRKALKGCSDQDLLGHDAIRKFYNLKSYNLNLDDYSENKSNRSFWDGRLPQEIKDAWNSGKLDGMLHYLWDEDFYYIFERVLPEFQAWLFKNKNRKGWVTRLAGYAAAQDWKGMKKDEHWIIRITGYVATQDLRGMMNDREGVICQVAQEASSYVNQRHLKRIECMKNSGASLDRLAAYVISQGLEGMKKDSDAVIRLAGYAATQDLEKITRPILVLAGYAATQDLEKIIRPIL